MFKKVTFLAVIFTFVITNTVMASSKQTIRVLALQSQGVKTFIPALVLNNLERVLGGSLSDKFDLVVADGGAGLVAVALGSKYSTSEILDLLANHSTEIYHQNRKTKFRSLFGGNKYSSEDYEKFLMNSFQRDRLSDLEKPVTLLAYDEESKDVVTFSGKSKEKKNDDISLIEAIRATTTAKRHYKPLELKEKSSQGMLFKDSQGHQKDILLHAFEEAKRQFPDSQNVVIVNIADSSQELSNVSERYIKADPHTKLFNIYVRLKKEIESDDITTDALNNMRYSVEDHFQTHRSQLRAVVNELIKDNQSDIDTTRTLIAHRAIDSEMNLDECLDEAEACVY